MRNSLDNSPSINAYLVSGNSIKYYHLLNLFYVTDTHTKRGIFLT